MPPKSMRPCIMFGQNKFQVDGPACVENFTKANPKRKADSSSILAKNCFSGRKGFFEVIKFDLKWLLWLI